MALQLQKLQSALKELQLIPLWASAPLFPWKIFSAELSKALDLKELEITHHKTEWLSGENSTAGMGTHPIVQAISLSPIHGNFFWIMPQKSRDTLIQFLLTKDESNKGFSDQPLQEGFYQYILLNVLSIFNSKGFYGDIVASLSEESELPMEGGLAIDVSIKRGSASLWGRILCPKETHASFNSHFAMQKPPLLSDPKLAHIPLPLQVEIGTTSLSASEWKKLRQGDLLLLDRCSYDLNHHRGNGSLTLGTTPLFDIRIKENEVKILEYALFLEETPMTNNEDEDLSRMDEEKHLWSADENEEKTEELLSSKKIPLTIVVEAGRLHMPLDQVTKLKPGNVLDLKLAPLPNVHLTIGGKRVAKGELVQLGDALGVRILQLGD
ncbi:MAG: type III secretion system cytoplasmic ring protein SctQ [Verrucomicrobia bacterium]|nr:type III secretion system cytoplasmic ring protein SctQ [Verrucomicrobiota bacterium]